MIKSKLFKLLLGIVCLVHSSSANGFFHFEESVSSLFQVEYFIHQKENLDWWQTGSFYQIYPRSFKDSDGDGIGDLNGITQNLPYLKEIGITATWLSPIFKSPMADFGYDISDFYDIQPEYGTMEDFDRLIARANELDIKILLDFVPNHSSDENEWFIKSVNREKGYENFYVWHPGFPDPNNASNRLPPTNWVSVFLGSAWQWNDIRKEFYLHQFQPKQPDLNYRDPNVVNTMKDVLRFWLKKGVAGFRVDAVPFLFEIKPDQDGNFKDEPVSGNTNDPNDYGYLVHVYTTELSETIDMIYQWRSVLDDHKKDHGGPSRVLLTESYASIEFVMNCYGDGKREGAQIPFNFHLITRLNQDSTAVDFKDSIDLWMNNMPKGRTANWVMGNHDQKRVATRFGVERIDIMNMILLSLPGASVTYNGEEIGMTDVWISWEDTKDPSACKTNSSVYERYSRDPERTPFQWDETFNAGFSNSSKTWLPLSPDYPKVNVKKEKMKTNSYFNIYKKLQQLRREEVMMKGSLITKTYKPDVLVIIRLLKGTNPIIVVINFGNNEVNVNLSEFDFVSDKLDCIIVDSKATRKPGDLVNRARIDLKQNEGVVLKSKKTYGFNENYYDYTII